MCDERERLIGYVYDECDPAERRAIEDHLEDCATCRAEIGGLRNVRQDLLAWDVPPHEAVWRPLVPAPVMPWYRQVPAWAMAAAAGVMFLVGAAGGVVTHALVPHQDAAVVTAATPVQMIPAGVTVSQLSEVEQRMVQMMRDELSKRQVAANGPVAVRAVPASAGTDLVLARLNEIVGASEQRQWEIVRDVQNEWRRSLDSLKRDVNGMKDAIVVLQSGGGR
jgi:anti-sigma factor RsiW